MGFCSFGREVGWFYTGSRIVRVNYLLVTVAGKNILANNKKVVLGIPACDSAGIQKRAGLVQCKQERESKQRSSGRDSLACVLVLSLPPSLLRAKEQSCDLIGAR